MHLDFCVQCFELCILFSLTHKYDLERGVFALDHDGECKSFMKDYLQCLKEGGTIGVVVIYIFKP